MLNNLYDLWLEYPAIYNPGFIVSLIIAGLGGYISFIKVKSKSWNIFFTSLIIALCSFVILIIFAIIVMLAVKIGDFNIDRSWTYFADSYVWGIFSLPFFLFILSLIIFFIRIRLFPMKKEDSSHFRAK